MATAISASGSAISFGTDQLRVQQAKRNADQAEAAARALRRAATSAQQAADSAQEDARALQVRSNQAQVDAGQARQQVTSLQSVRTVQEGFETVRSQIAEGLKSLDAPAPTVNAEGQTTGMLVNVTA